MYIQRSQAPLRYYARFTSTCIPEHENGCIYNDIVTYKIRTKAWSTWSNAKTTVSRLSIHTYPSGNRFSSMLDNIEYKDTKCALSWPTMARTAITSKGIENDAVSYTYCHIVWTWCLIYKETNSNQIDQCWMMMALFLHWHSEARLVVHSRYYDDDLNSRKTPSLYERPSPRSVSYPISLNHLW